MRASVSIHAVLSAAAAMTIVSVPSASAEEDPISLDAITVSATRTEEKVIDTMAGASIVTRQEIDRFQPDAIGDVFRSVPGVETQEDGDDPGAAINIRGLQDFGRVNVMIEGARQNFQRSGHGANGTFYLEPELVQYVDITRGPVSTIYGSGAIGGVVNFNLVDASDFLREGETRAISTKGRFSFNDSGTLSSTTAATRIGKGFDVLANVVWRRDDDYRDGNNNVVPYTGENVLTGLLKASYTPVAGHTFSATALHQKNDYDQGSITSLRDTTTSNSTLVGRYAFDSVDTSLIDFSASGYYTGTRTDQTKVLGTNVGTDRSFDLDTIGTDIFNTARFDIGPFSHALTLGVDAFSDAVKTSDPAGSGDEFTPSGDRLIYGAYVQQQINLGTWLEVIGALRFDGYSLSGSTTESDGSRVSPKITVGVTPIKGLQFYGTYAEGYRAPAITEVFNTGTHDPSFPFVFLPNPDLRPETAHNIEFGVNAQWDGVIRHDDAMRFKATWFHNEIDDYIEGDITGFNPRTCFRRGRGCGTFQYRNVANATIEGFEVEAAYDIGPFFGRLAYSQIRGDDETADQPLQSIRPDKASFTFGAKAYEERLTLGGRITIVDAQNRVAPGDTALISDEYELLDLFATYEHNETLSFALSLNNVLGKSYTKYLNTNPSPGFNASLSATIRFGS